MIAMAVQLAESVAAAGRGERGSMKWALFGLTTPEIAAYHLVSAKSAAAARKILAGFSGTLVVDGYAVYPLVATLEGSMRIDHCWAHVDRKFKDAKDPPEAIAKVRSLITKLYEIERKVEGPFPGSPGWPSAPPVPSPSPTELAASTAAERRWRRRGRARTYDRP